MYTIGFVVKISLQLGNIVYAYLHRYVDVIVRKSIYVNYVHR
jgi:hypothetical protein